MGRKIRLGVIGANVKSPWGAVSHFPAALASPDVEISAVCTTRPESAAQARVALRAQEAYTDYRELVRSPLVDAVVVVVKVPSHHGPTRAAIEAG